MIAPTFSGEKKSAGDRVPAFVCAILRDEPPTVYGDGEQSRDFTYIDNVVESNLLAAQAPDAAGEAFNVGCGERTSLLQVIALIEKMIGRRIEIRHHPKRGGDVAHTLADVSKAKRLLGYSPLVDFPEGLRRTVEFFKPLA